MSVGLSLDRAVAPAAPVVDLSPLSDEQLLARFFQQREDAAFEAIVKRHGPVVFGVCRRILSDANDAEDAFQATFMVLVRKGAALRQPGRLSSWLYGVANRTARKVKLKAALRTRSERQAGERTPPTAVSEMNYEELHAILDEEIAQLPEKYALPLVLCYLEGKTNAQAAEQLGWPEGSISRRLSRGRELLRSRLMRRGLALSAALIAAVFAKSAAASVPAELASATVQAGHLVVSGVKLQEVVSPRAAKVVGEILTDLSAASRTTSASLLAAASILLVLTTAIWQFGSPAYAASLLGFGGKGWAHGLFGAVSHCGAEPLAPVEAPVAASCCSTPATTSGEAVVAAPPPAAESAPAATGQSQVGANKPAAPARDAL
jgi:RNA polymerase sigma factor (sigma-70 family)